MSGGTCRDSQAAQEAASSMAGMDVAWEGAEGVSSRPSIGSSEGWTGSGRRGNGDGIGLEL